MSGRKPAGLFGLNIFFAWNKSAADGVVSIGGVSKDMVRHAVRLQNSMIRVIILVWTLVEVENPLLQ